MLYAGHCYTDCQAGWGVTMLGATSSDGLTWQKLDHPVLQGTTLGLDWTKDGVAEPALLYDNGVWYLFFTSLQGATREIGLASGPSPFWPLAGPRPTDSHTNIRRLRRLIADKPEATATQIST
jgi:hypothetical protein